MGDWNYSYSNRLSDSVADPEKNRNENKKEKQTE